MPRALLNGHTDFPSAVEAGPAARHPARSGRAAAPDPGGLAGERQAKAKRPERLNWTGRARRDDVDPRGGHHQLPGPRRRPDRPHRGLAEILWLDGGRVFVSMAIIAFMFAAGWNAVARLMGQ
jgi:hypothetical protein